MTHDIEINIKTAKNIRDMAYTGKDEFFSDKTLRQFTLFSNRNKKQMFIIPAPIKQTLFK